MEPRPKTLVKMAKPAEKTEQSLFEDDDEFEEFPVEGNFYLCNVMYCTYLDRMGRG